MGAAASMGTEVTYAQARALAGPAWNSTWDAHFASSSGTIPKSLALMLWTMEAQRSQRVVDAAAAAGLGGLSTLHGVWPPQSAAWTAPNVADEMARQAAALHAAGSLNNPHAAESRGQAAAALSSPDLSAAERAALRDLLTRPASSSSRPASPSNPAAAVAAAAAHREYFSLHQEQTEQAGSTTTALAVGQALEVVHRRLEGARIEARRQATRADALEKEVETLREATAATAAHVQRVELDRLASQETAATRRLELENAELARKVAALERARPKSPTKSPANGESATLSRRVEELEALKRDLVGRVDQCRGAVDAMRHDRKNFAAANDAVKRELGMRIVALEREVHDLRAAEKRRVADLALEVRRVADNLRRRLDQADHHDRVLSTQVKQLLDERQVGAAPWTGTPQTTGGTYPALEEHLGALQAQVANLERRLDDQQTTFSSAPASATTRLDDEPNAAALASSLEAFRMEVEVKHEELQMDLDALNKAVEAVQQGGGSDQGALFAPARQDPQAPVVAPTGDEAKEVRAQTTPENSREKPPSPTKTKTPAAAAPSDPDTPAAAGVAESKVDSPQTTPQTTPQMTPRWRTWPLVQATAQNPHPLANLKFKLQPKILAGAFLMYTPAERRVGASGGEQGAMVLKFVPVAGKVGAYMLSTLERRWLGCSYDNDWCYAKYPKSEAGEFEFVVLEDSYVVQLCDSGRKDAALYLTHSGDSDARWLRAAAPTAKDALAFALVPVA